MNYISLFLTYVLAVAPQEASSFSSSSVGVGRGQVRSLPSITSTPYQYKSRLSLSSTTNGEDADISSDKKVDGRKNRVIIGYKAMMITYLAVGFRSIAKVGLTPSIVHMLGGYIVMPAGVSYIMSGAATNDRLGSDTYKRLNLALLEYGLIGLSIISLGKGGNKLLSVAYILSVINSLKGYAYGVLGWDKQSTETTLLKDLMNGTKDNTIKGFLSMPKNVKAAGYQVATYFTAFLKLEKLWEIVKFIQANSITAELSMSLARFNRLAFLTLMVYTLKDAADRDRLGGGTFIKLNYLCALAMSIQCAFNSGGFTTPSGILSAVFSLFFAFNGVASYMKNQYA